MGRLRIDPDTFFDSIRKRLTQLISRELKDLRSARVRTTAWIRFRQDFQFVELAFNSRMTDFHKASDIERLVDLMINHMRGQIENPALINSRFVFEEVLFKDVNFHRLNLTRGGTHLPLPKFVEAKRALVNPQNQDNECFKWAVLTALHNSEIKFNPERISKLRKFESMYDWSDLSFSTSLKDISKFEFKNSLTINVLGFENRDIYLCRKGIAGNKLVNLLLVCDGDKWHYTAVKSLSRLLGSSNSKHAHKQHFCTNCLQGFNEEKTRDNHYLYCSNNETVRVEMPKDPILKFSNGQGQLKAPLVIYADFESILEPIATDSNDPSISHINHINKHTPSGLCTYSTFAFGDIANPLKLYRGKDCVEECCKYIRSQAYKLYNDYPEKPMIPLTSNQWKEYNSSNTCHICLKPIKESKVRDHCHYTGYQRGPAHSMCNLRYKVPSFIPVVFHNLSGYDAHMFIKELAKYSTNDMNVIEKSKENYISFSSHVQVLEYDDGRVKTIELRFIDSYKFMTSSLDSPSTT